MEDSLRYPIGKFDWTQEFTAEKRQQWIHEISELPQQLGQVVAGMTEEQLSTPYRPNGWTVRQVVHHIPDSHLNSYVRMKLALTEDEPTIKPYFEDRWAQLHDYNDTPIDVSLALLTALHRRWVVLLKSLAPHEFNRSFNHPEAGRITLEQTVGLYAWHGKHHLAHITSLAQRMGW